MSQPRILHVVYSLIRGGTEGQCALTATMLQGRYGDHSVAAFDRSGYYLLPVEASCGPVHEIPIRSVRTPKTLLQMYHLSYWMKEQHFDLVHCWDADANIFASVAAKWAGIPFLTSHRDTLDIYPGWKMRCMAWAGRRARAVIANAAVIVPLLEAMGIPSANIRVVPNLLDLDSFDRMQTSSELPPLTLPEPPRLAMVARLDKEKDTPTLVRALHLVRQRKKDVSLVVVGDGEDRARVETLCSELGLQDDVCFLGEFNQVPALLREVQIAALVPRANEGLSNSILEYMAAGLPCVVTDCGGNAELVRDGENGYVVPIEDPTAVASALERLLSDPALSAKMGQRGRARIEKEFAVEPVLQRFQGLYEDVLADS